MDKQRLADRIEAGIELEKKLQYDKAHEIYESVLSELDKLDNLQENEIKEKHELMASVLMRKGNLMMVNENQSEAEKYLKESLVHAQKSQDSITIGRSTLGLGVHYGSIGDLESSEQLLKEARSIFEAKDDFDNQQGLGWCLLTLGGFYAKLGKIEMAFTQFDEAIQVLEKINNFVGVATTYEYRATINRQLDKPDDSKQDLENAIKYYEKEGMEEKAEEVRKSLSEF